MDVYVCVSVMHTCLHMCVDVDMEIWAAVWSGGVRMHGGDDACMLCNVLGELRCGEIAAAQLMPCRENRPTCAMQRDGGAVSSGDTPGVMTITKSGFVNSTSKVRRIMCFSSTGKEE